MKLSDILENVRYEILGGDINTDVKHLSIDSRNIRKGTLFMCIMGFRVDGHNYIDDAVELGASVVLVEKEIDVSRYEDVTVIRVENTRYAMAYITSNFYEHPQNAMKLVGVTGTNGKTSVSFYMQSVLHLHHQ